jgi:NAD(P)-dependent dehydrogenase (short-subunit alcohol dehydrogenase family)
MLPAPLTAFDLTGRVALVTGARREIGRAIATALAGLGAMLAIHHRGTPEEQADADEAVAAIHNAGGKAQDFAADFVQADAGRKLADDVVGALGRVDILVLNASIELVEGFEEISGEHFDRQVNVNLRSSFELLQALVPPMAARGWGRVVTIGSVQQQRPHPRMFVYAGSKAMQHNWARNLSRQYGRQGVTVNNLAPGAIATARNQAQLTTERAAIEARIPVGRVGTPGDLIGAAMLLCSDAGSYINGADFYVDGGLSIA